jgi:hypothetical protein
VLLATIAAAGCTSHYHSIGLGPTGSAEQSERQYYFLFGLIRINEVDPGRMAADLTSYSIETEFSFTDLLLSPLLIPLTVTSRTVTVRT